MGGEPGGGHGGGWKAGLRRRAAEPGEVSGGGQMPWLWALGWVDDG